MAESEDEAGLPQSTRIRRQVGRTIANWLMILSSLAIIGGWAWTGLYQLDPGESAVVLRIGKFNRTVDTPGLKWHWPSPLEYVDKVNVAQVRKEMFGFQDVTELQPGVDTATFETAIQTAGNNIVNLSYVVQYQINDPFSFLYGLEDPESMLRDAAQSAVREVIGRKSIDDVLSDRRRDFQREAEAILQATFDKYFEENDFVGGSPFLIDSLDLQLAQAPVAVKDAFEDVVAARQDQERSSSIAEGDAKEILQRAQAQAEELTASAKAYRDARILEARGEAERFVALQQEYARAPRVTRRRLYLEAMEEVLPGIEKVIVEPDTVNLLPFFPLAAPQAAPRGEAAEKPAEDRR